MTDTSWRLTFISAFALHLALAAGPAGAVVCTGDCDGNGADGLAGAAAVLASPGGASVYVAGSHDSAIAIFQVEDSPLVRDGAACDYDEHCASGVCDFLLGGFGPGGPAGPIFAKVCCQHRCALEEACDASGVCQSRFPAP